MHGFTHVAEGERSDAAWIKAGLTEVQVFVEDSATARRQDGAGWNAVFPQIQTAVAEEPSAEVDGDGGAVVQLNPVAGFGFRIGEEFVDDDGVGQGVRVIGGAVRVECSDVGARVVGINGVGWVSGVDGRRFWAQLVILKL